MSESLDLLKLFKKLGIEYDLSNYSDGYCVSTQKRYSGIEYFIDFIFDENDNFVEMEVNHVQ